MLVNEFSVNEYVGIWNVYTCMIISHIIYSKQQALQNAEVFLLPLLNLPLEK